MPLVSESRETNIGASACRVSSTEVSLFWYLRVDQISCTTSNFETRAFSLSLMPPDPTVMSVSR